MVFASALLAGGLLLGGCVTDATTAAGTSALTASVSESVATSTTTADATTTADTISTSAAAAEAFLATLSDEQRDQVTYAFDDETKTTSWSNFPVTFVDRAGLNPADLTDKQQAAAMKVLEALPQR